MKKLKTLYTDLMKKKTLADLERMGLCFQPWHPGQPESCGFPNCDCWEVKAAKEREDCGYAKVHPQELK